MARPTSAYAHLQNTSPNCTGLGGVDPYYMADDDLWAGEEIPQQYPFGMFGNPAAMQGIGAYAGRSGPGMFSPEAMAQMAQEGQAWCRRSLRMAWVNKGFTHGLSSIGLEKAASGRDSTGRQNAWP